MGIDPNDLYCKKIALIETAKRCFERGLQTNMGGNISVRLNGVEAIVIKPSGIGFKECTIDNLMIAGFDGSVIEGHLKPSKDLEFHADLYRLRPDIGAVVHVHSPWATAWASAGMEIPFLTVQTIEKLGKLPLIPLSPEGGAQSAADISPVMEDKSVNAVLLANHGVVGVGPTLMEAQYFAELVEETAHTAFVRENLLAIHHKEDGPLPRRSEKQLSR